MSGTQRPLVLLHPVGLDATYWEPYAKRFAPLRHVVPLDLPGHGTSPVLEGPVTLGGMADRIAGAVADLGGPADVAGVSMGGMVAQYLAAAHPRLVTSLILCSTSGGFPEAARPGVAARGDAALADGMSAVVGTTLERWFSPGGRDAEIGRRTADTLRAVDPAVWAACWQAISELDTLAALRTVDVPALVVTGDADTSTTPAMAEAIASALPHARLEIVPGAWHLGAFEEPEEFAPLMERFLTGL
jgi:3-oxoadipate enol-lactonase